MDWAIWPVELEIRQGEGEAGGATIKGRFPYNETAIVRDRGTVRKERIKPRAFAFAVNDKSREINLLAGHSFDKPLASRGGGTLDLVDTDDALEFVAKLPSAAERPSWANDAILAMRGGLVRGVSPGFRVPPAAVVPDAERLVPEPGNPGVQIREIRAAVLYEISVVSRPAYLAASLQIEERAEAFGIRPVARRRLWL